MSKQKKQLFELLEQELARPLTRQEKAQAIKDLKKVKKSAKEMSKLFKGRVPDMPFEQWAAENDINPGQDFKNQIRQINTPQKQSKPWTLRMFIAPLAAACMLCLSISLPLTLSKAGGPSESGQTYTDKISTIPVSLDDIYKLENAILFNRIQLLYYKSTYKDIANDDGKDLMYAINNCWYLLSDGINAFKLDFKVRMYKKYNFPGYINYKINSETFEVYYNVASDALAFISFTDASYDYFLEVRPFIMDGMEFPITEITMRNLELLINDLFSSRA